MRRRNRSYRNEKLRCVCQLILLLLIERMHAISVRQSGQVADSLLNLQYKHHPPVIHPLRENRFSLSVAFLSFPPFSSFRYVHTFEKRNRDILDIFAPPVPTTSSILPGNSCRRSLGHAGERDRGTNKTSARDQTTTFVCLERFYRSRRPRKMVFFSVTMVSLLADILTYERASPRSFYCLKAFKKLQVQQ